MNDDELRDYRRELDESHEKLDWYFEINLAWIFRNIKKFLKGEKNELDKKYNL